MVIAHQKIAIAQQFYRIGDKPAAGLLPMAVNTLRVYRQMQPL